MHFICQPLCVWSKTFLINHNCSTIKMDVRVCVRAYDTLLNIMIDFYAQASNVAVNMDSFLIGWAHAAGMLWTMFNCLYFKNSPIPITVVANCFIHFMNPPVWTAKQTESYPFIYNKKCHNDKFVITICASKLNFKEFPQYFNQMHTHSHKKLNATYPCHWYCYMNGNAEHIIYAQDECSICKNNNQCVG